MKQSGHSQLVAKLNAEKSALYLGRSDGRVTFGSTEDHLLAIGPSRCGKTSGLIAPSAAVHPGPAIIVSTRDDLLAATLNSRLRIAKQWGGDVVEVIFGGQGTGLCAAKDWSVTDGCSNWNSALDRADNLVRTAIPAAKEQFWRGAAADVLSGSLFAAALLGEDDRILARRIRTRDLTVYQEKILDAVGGDHDAAYVLAGMIDELAMADDTRRSVIATISSQVLSPFRFERKGGNAAKVDLATFVRGWGTLYVTVAPERAEATCALVAAFIESATSAWRSEPTKQGTLLLALDEVANVAPLPNLSKILTAGAGDGIQCILGMQEPTQANRWANEAGVILGSPSQVAVYPGLRGEYLRTLSDSARQSTHYDLQVVVKDNLPSAPRLADADRLISERLWLERSLYRISPRLRTAAAKRLISSLHVARLRDGLLNREGASTVTASEELLDELMLWTELKRVPVRRSAVELNRLSEGRKGEFYLLSRGTGTFRTFKHWSRDDLWRYIMITQDD